MIPRLGTFFYLLAAQIVAHAGQSAPGRCRGMAGCGIVDARLLCGPALKTPPLARVARIHGAVRVAAAVDERGEVRSMLLLAGHPLLVEAAMDAAKRYRFQPATCAAFQ